MEKLLSAVATLPTALLRRLILTLNVPEREPASLSKLRCEILVIKNLRPSGFGSNHNRAFDSCLTPWFLVTNPDLHFRESPFAGTLQAASAKDALLSPKVIEMNGREADSARRVPTPIEVLKRRFGMSHEAVERDFDWLAGMFLLIRSEAFQHVGGFDERYYMYCEDVDLCLRMQLAGWSIKQVSGVEVIHDAQRASHRSLRHLRWHVSSLLRLWRSPVLRQYMAQREQILARRAAGAATTPA